MSDPAESLPVVRIRGLAAGGAGVADLPDGRVVFVPATAPGDRARVRIIKEKPRWAWGEMVDLIESGKARRPAPCPFYGTCGGCTLQHLPYSGQLEAKAGFVTDALQRIGGEVDVPEVEVWGSPLQFAYRSRMSFHLVRRPDGGVVAGFHRLGRPGEIVDVDGRCLLPEAPLTRAWNDLRSSWGRGAVLLPMGRKLRLTLRRVSPGVVLRVETDAGKTGGVGNAVELLRRVEGLVAIWLESGKAPARILAGDPDTVERWNERVLRLGPGAFLQVNRSGATGLERSVLELVGPPRGRRIIDAYCGVGSFSHTLAQAGADVVGIELDPVAARAAATDAPAGLRIVEGRAEDHLEQALPADLVILNPPRTGLHEAVSTALLPSPVTKILYVSCDPATLARDIRRLSPGYRLREVRSFDLFPQTAHVETLAVLARVTEAARS